MMISERHSRIVLELQNNPDITVTQLSQILNYSEPTIRRDLTELDKKGIITKHYGRIELKEGAADREIPYILRENEQSRAKVCISLIASQYIEDGMVIMLDGSTSTFYLVPQIAKHKDIIVITSGAKTAVALAELQVPVYSTGGRMRLNSFTYVGSEAEEMVKKFNADVMFFSCHGLSENGMMSDVSVEEASLRRVMFKRSKKKYLLCDSSKYGQTFFYDMGNISEIDEVISEKPFPPFVPV